MHMVEHEAVRKNCKRPFVGCTTKLRKHQTDSCCLLKGRATVDRAEREEIPIWSNLSKPADARRARHRRHACRNLAASSAGPLRGTRPTYSSRSAGPLRGT